MHMLDHWFRDYPHVSTILSGPRTIANARLFTDGLSDRADCLYVGRVADFFPETPSEEILIMYRQDVISIKSDDLNQIFNMVLSAFDYYQELEAQMLNVILQPEPEQCIISACEQLLGPTFLMRKDYRILAVSQNYSGKPVNRFWKNFVADREPTLELANFMRDSTINKLTEHTQHMTLFREPHAAPYDYGICNTYSDYEGKTIGNLIIASNKPITPFELDIAEIIVDMLKRLQTKAAISQQLAGTGITNEILFSNLLSDIDAERSAHFLQASMNLLPQEICRILTIHSENDSLFTLIRRRISQSLPSAIITQQAAQLSCLIRIESPAEIEEKICPLMENLTAQIPLTIGISNPFSDLIYCKYFFRQAHYAASAKTVGLTLFSQVAIPYLMQAAEVTDRRCARHPAIPVLEKIDADEQTPLIETLREYLICERSIKRAAERLFIHRNTVLYRLDQMREVVRFNLDCEEERIYLLLSLLNS